MIIICLVELCAQILEILSVLQLGGDTFNQKKCQLAGNHTGVTNAGRG
jgi:hypothetical protein